MMENPNTERNVLIDYFHILAAVWGALFCFSLEVIEIGTTVNTPLFHCRPSHHTRDPPVLETCFVVETVGCWFIS